MIATARAIMARTAAKLNVTCQKIAKPVLFFNLKKNKVCQKIKKNSKQPK
jgi:hypothetical protein